MREKRCFFIGHRDTTEEVLPALRVAVEQHITEYGITEFLVGHYGGFDRLAAQCVMEAKQTNMPKSDCPRASRAFRIHNPLSAIIRYFVLFFCEILLY